MKASYVFKGRESSFFSVKKLLTNDQPKETLLLVSKVYPMHFPSFFYTSGLEVNLRFLGVHTKAN